MPAAAGAPVARARPKQKVLAILGGSQGATALNAWARAPARGAGLRGDPGGLRDRPRQGGPETLVMRSKSGEPVKAVFMPFCDRSPSCSRPRTSSSRARRRHARRADPLRDPGDPDPYPHAASDHQRANASFFERQGGGLVVEESALGGSIPRCWS
jgi:UDP-N-acetylglucosamine--N-acetylmuramyl-(pentapeptide) pyrophosphoryl-undecaprenol N-acetylglucosamine transferase